MIKTADILKKAKALSAAAAPLDTSVKNRAIGIMADELENSAAEILKANAKDVKNASGKISDVMLDRLRLDSARIKAMADGMRAVAVLPDPVGRVLSETKRENGLNIKKVSVPLGVVAIIYESRPNVTSDAAVLCFKSGNVCVLRSGKEAFLSASAVVSALKRGLIPRGGKGLISACVENATVPCIETGTGICHIYVDKSADTDMAVNVVDNAKASRPSVCNAAEVCLVHRDIAAEFLPKLAKRFKDRVELRGDKEVCGIINAVPAGENDFDTEFLDYIMAVAIVDSTEEAVRHIGRHSTHHSESIITNDSAAADYFTARVDSAAVYVNASTRFTDGGEFGLGCEMGISTQKLHARGPLGLAELCSYKTIVRGSGQIR